MTTLVLPVPGTTADYPAPDNWAELLVEALQALNAGKVEGFADPGADRIVFWDDSAGAWAAMSVTSPLEISGTTLQVNSATLAETIRDTMATALVAGTNITITPNDGSDTITIAASGGGGTPPDASETVKGIIELATNAEVQTGTDTVRAVTPAGLASRTATETRTGIAEIATAAEVSTGTDDARIVTPLKLKTQLDLKAPLASPAFTGNPTAPTPATTDDDTSVATTAFVHAAITDDAITPDWFTAEGDLIAGFAAGSPGVLPVGTNGQVLTADSAASFGLKWATPAAGGGGFGLIPKVGQYLYPASGASWATSADAFASGTQPLVPIWIPVGFTADALATRIATAEAAVPLRILLYNSDSEGHPSTLVATGTAASGAVGTHSVSITPVALAPGLYWGAVRSDAGTTLRVWALGSNDMVGSPTFAGPSPILQRNPIPTADVGTHASPTNVLTISSYSLVAGSNIPLVTIRRA